MENPSVSMTIRMRTGIGACTVLAAFAILAPAGARAALIVPHAEPAEEGLVTPHVAEPAPVSPPPAPTPAPSTPPPSSAGSSGSTAPAGQAPSASPWPSGPNPSPELEAAGRHRFVGTPDFYVRDPVGLIFQMLPMSAPLEYQLREYIAEQRDLLATTQDLSSYLEVMGKIADAELKLGYILGWDPKFSPDVEAEARHRFAGTPDFYQRDPVEAIFSALPSNGPTTSIVDELRDQLASSSNNDPMGYIETLRELVRVEEVLGRLEEAQAAQGQLATRAILGYSEVGDTPCDYANDYSFINNDDLRNAGGC